MGTPWQLGILYICTPRVSGPFQVPLHGPGIIIVVRKQPPKILKALNTAQSVTHVYIYIYIYIYQYLLDTPSISISFVCVPLLQGPTIYPIPSHHCSHVTTVLNEFTPCVSPRDVHYSSLSPSNNSSVMRIPAQRCTLVLNVGNSPYYWGGGRGGPNGRGGLPQLS